MSEIKAGDRVIYGYVRGQIVATHGYHGWFVSDGGCPPYTVCLNDCQLEPPKPIEWIEAIPGVLLHSGEWSIRLDGSYYHVFVGVRRKSYHSNIADAKASAEQKMREGGR